MYLAAARARQTIIAANVELRERELVKLATLASALGDALRSRGVPDPAASLAAEVGIAAFKVAFARWVEDADDADDARDQTLAQIIRETVDQMKAVAAGRTGGRPAADRLESVSAHLNGDSAVCLVPAAPQAHGRGAPHPLQPMTGASPRASGPTSSKRGGGA
jgi:hypothetical protein